MTDLRSRGRVPYGYEIVDGKARVNGEEAACLKLYFQRFLAGEPMRAAAREARLPCAQTTLPHLFQRKEYTGTGFYPPIITEAYQRALIAEWERRKTGRAKPVSPQSGVKIYREFWLEQGEPHSCGDPAASAAALYRRIRPKTEAAKPADRDGPEPSKNKEEQRHGNSGH